MARPVRPHCGVLLLLLAAGTFARADVPPPPAPVPVVPAPPAPPVPAPAPPSPPPPATRSPFDLGTFALAPAPVVDADTLKLDDPRESVRVQGIDAEEVFHEPADRRAAAADFPAYARDKRGSHPTPVKFATPAGEAARRFVVALLDGVKAVRLEADEVGRERDGFGRRLAHVLWTREGREALLSEEVVRAGWSPYFVKYGRSLRYDARLRAAQAEARAGRRGIWGDAVAHYPDYDERLAWWEARAKQVDTWAEESRAHPDAFARIRLGVPPETGRLPALLGRRVTLFATLEREVTDAGPKRLLLTDAPERPFEVVVRDEAVWKALDHAAISSRFVRVSGTLGKYRGRLEVALERAEDLSTK